MMFEEDEMSSSEKSKLPYSLLIDPETGRAAAYTNNHQLITPQASAQLIAFAQANPSREMLWSEKDHNAIPERPGRELPDWAVPEVRARCVLLWIKRGSAPDDYWRSIPAR